MDKIDIVPTNKPGTEGEEIVEYKSPRELEPDAIEDDEAAERAGPDENYQFWRDQLTSALVYENRWRMEAQEAEQAYFGPDNDPGRSSGASDGTDPNKITDKTALIHGTIDTLKPLVFSETPQPVVRRRFNGDGKVDPVNVMSAEVAQRLAQFLVEDGFDKAMESVRDDWLITGRGAGRVIYDVDIVDVAVPEYGSDENGDPLMVPVKSNENLRVSSCEWARVLFAAVQGWEEMPWIAFEVPMTRTRVAKRFGEEKAEAISYNGRGLIGQSRAEGDDDLGGASLSGDDAETEAKAVSPFDTVKVWEIWDKERRQVIWWCDTYKEGILDKVPDPLELEDFWPMPAPLLATTKGKSLCPRPDMNYYIGRAEEIDLASNKMKSILKALSVSALVPGTMITELEKLLNGTNQIIAISDWIALMDKGGTNNIMQWLPIEAMIKAIQALAVIRSQAKEAMFEASGVSDVMRAQGDPNETATAQQIKGRYAGLRLADRQRRMAEYARDMIKIMLEIGLEHFDTETIAEMTGLDLPITEAERQEAIIADQLQKAKFQQIMSQYQLMQQAAQKIEQEGGQPLQLPPPPEPPEEIEIPETSYEAIHERLRDDFKRKISITIETNSTVLADEQADKEARIEFLKAFSMFVRELAPLAGTGQFDFKAVKELLMFGVRGFPQSRTLENMIASLPDEPQGESPEDTAVTVAKIRAEVDKMSKQMDLANSEKDRQHELKLKGVDLIKDAAMKDAEGDHAPIPPAMGV